MISGRMAWTVVGCVCELVKDGSAGSTVAGTPAPSSRLAGSGPVMGMEEVRAVAGRRDSTK